MIISDKVMVTIHNLTKKHWAELGYLDANRTYHKGFSILVYVKDLLPNSRAYVKVECDYCHETFDKHYVDIIKGRKTISKDCCINCRAYKTAEIFKVTGVDYPMRRPEIRELFSGENSSWYKPELTDEERVAARNTPEYKHWTKAVYKKASHCCEVCGKKDKLHAHHKNSWDRNREQRYDVKNGVALCEKCHDEFHAIYGRGKNTDEEFIEFRNNHGITAKELEEKIEYRKKINYLPNAKKIIRLEDGEIYSSIRDAAKANNIKSATLSWDLVNKSQSKDGFHYSYYQEGFDEEARFNLLEERQLKAREKTIWNARKIICLETSQIFNSTGAAAEFLGVTPSVARSGICKVISGIQKTYKNYHFALA